MKLKVYLITVLFLAVTAMFSQENKLVVPHVDPSLAFTQNKGQWNSKINYRARFAGGTLYMEGNGITYDFYDRRNYKNWHMGGCALPGGDKLKMHAIRLEFVGCNTDHTNEASDEGVFYENFYLGNDKSKWKSGVKNYHQIWYRNLYNNIDYQAITTIRGLKYNFYVKPNADPTVIQLKYIGAERVRLKKDQLVIKTSIDSIMEKKPYAFQRINDKIVEVVCKYKLKNNIVSFEFPNGYDKNYELVIDPVLVFAAQSGSLADNFGMTATYDNAGNLYSGGTVFDNGFPTTTGAYSISFTGTTGYGITDIVITKYNSIGTAQLFSTYIGGTESEIVTSLIVDANSNLFLYGATGSSNFPMAGSSYDPTFNGGNYLFFLFNGTLFNNGTDIYVAKLNSTGTSLLASTFVGGSDNDGVNHTNGVVTHSVSWSAAYTPTPSTNTGPCIGYSVANYTISENKVDSLQHNYGDQYRGEIELDKFGNVYIASSTRSSNFPIVSGFDNSLGGKQDAVIFKLNSTLSTLMWSTYLGGSLNESGNSLIVSDSLFTYVTGGTCSADFPVSPGCFNTSFNGGQSDAYIVKINPTGNLILKSTYVGTNAYDQSYFIAAKKGSTDVYIYGQSLGSMTVTSGAYSNPGSHQFITRLDGQLNNVNMGTVFGSGSNKLDISPSAFSVDNCGNIYTSGWGGPLLGLSPLTNPPTTGMPVTSGAIQPASANGYDFYLMVLAQNATSLLYGTYFGGACSQEHVDGGTSRFDPKGIIYQSVCAGCQNNEDFPVTPGAWPNTPLNHNKSDNCNNGVFKFDFGIKITNVTIITNTISGCSPLTVNFANSTYAGGNYLWYFGPGDTTSQILNPIKTFTAPGTYTVSLVVRDTSSCNKKDSVLTYITVMPGIKADFTYTVVPCSDTIKYTNLSVATPTSVILTNTWNFIGIGTSTVTNPTQTVSFAGTYSTALVVTNNFGCKDSIAKTFSITPFVPVVITPDTICFGQKPVITAGGGTSYTWSPASSLSNPNSFSPTASPSVTTIYSVAITNTITGCSKTLTTSITVNPKPNADYTYTINPCGGGVNFTDISTASITNWNWNFGNAQTSVLQNPSTFYANGGSFTVSLLVNNSFGCSDTIVKPITVPTPPPVSISSSVTICSGHAIQLNASGGVAYAWLPANTLNNQYVANPVATPTGNTTYSVTISTINVTSTLIPIGDTCKFNLSTAVNVTTLSTIVAAVGADPDTVVKGNSSILTLTCSPGAFVAWYPLNGTNPAYGYTVSTTPQQTTTYTVSINRGPCTETLVVTVYVIDDVCEESDIFVPNTFTPNGDGQNDIMYVRGAKISEVYFAIYNRWGEMVFETKDKAIGWDGIYKGRPADVGVFGYYVKAKCPNGLVTFKKGNITLIR